jgi:hypothetical protein
MSFRMEVSKVKKEVNEVTLHVEDDDITTLKGLHPGNRMLVDSDQLSFIYILDTEDELVYVSIPKEAWPALKEAADQEIPVMLTFSNTSDSIELVSLISELSYLVENITGNSNYGDEMVESVEQVFTKHQD